MSIATLKRKTKTQYNNMSVNQKQFSLNGGHRSQGWVGQTMLSRSLPRTLAKGNTLRGSGGLYGKFQIHPIIQSAVLSTEQYKITKSSVISGIGLINTKYRWIRRPYPYSTVKSLELINTNWASNFITWLRRKTLQNEQKCNLGTPKCSSQLKVVTTTPCDLSNTNSQKTNDSLCKTLTKSNTCTGAMNQSEYLDRLDKACADLDTYKILRIGRSCSQGKKY
jgi:hypothetical protein